MFRDSPQIRKVSLAIAALLLPGALFAAGALPVSPGDLDGQSPAVSGCPPFRWSTSRPDSRVEIAIFQVAEGTSAKVAGPLRSATHLAAERQWLPAASDCLPAGRYAWTIREVDGAQWSDPLLFEVADLPSAAELRAAIALIERHLAASAATDTNTGHATATSPTNGKGAGDTTAVQGVVPDSSGSTRGVHGTVASAEGVGVLAENTHPAGFDLQLAGPVGALLRDGEWRQNSGTAQSLNFTNPSGAMSLQVQGQTVVTTATDQNTTYVAGNQLTLVGNTFNVVEGASSGLDADTVDGLHASEIVAGAHDHFGQSWSGDAATGLTVSNANAAGSGLRGVNTATSGFNHGVRGSASSVNGRGLFGEATAVTGTAFGVFGISSSVDGHGVHGRADAVTGPGIGVFGRSRSPSGVGGLFVNDGSGLLLAADNVAAPGLNFLEFSVDNIGNVIAESYAGDGSPLTGMAASLFDVFGGDGSDGARVVAGTEAVPLRAQYTTLTINAGAILQTSTSDGRAYIAVQGLCSIRGTINGRGRGATGALAVNNDLPGQTGRDASMQISRDPLAGCVSGAGGGGGDSTGWSGGFGGGAEGIGASNNGDAAQNLWKRVGISGGSYGLSVANATWSDGFADIVNCPGAGGGSGSTTDSDGVGSTNSSGKGGNGGAVIYLECGQFELISGSVLDARGENGGTGICTGGECATQDGSGGGGGGGGGVVLVRTREVLSQAGQVLVSGGSSGAAAGFNASTGGAGAAGFADIVVVR